MEVALHRWLLRAAPFSIILASEIRASSISLGSSMVWLIGLVLSCGEKEHHHPGMEQAKGHPCSTLIGNPQNLSIRINLWGPLTVKSETAIFAPGAQLDQDYTALC